MKLLPNKHIVISLALLCAVICPVIHATQLPATIDDALDLLGETVDSQHKYFKIREDRIDSLKSLARAGGDVDVARTNRDIAKEYSHFQIDSALVYFTKAAEMFAARGDSIHEMESNLRYAALLPIIGATDEAQTIYDSYQTASMCNEMKRLYYECGNQMFFFLSTTYPLADRRQYFLKRGEEATVNYLKYVEDPVAADFYQAELDFINHNDFNITAFAVKLEDVPMTHRFFARSASLVGDYYNHVLKDADKSLYYKALASISDIMTANREEMALQSVGMSLYDRDDIERAYKYLMVSLDHAVKSGAKVHLTNTAKSLPAIADSFSELDQRKFTVLTVLVIALAVALIVIVASLFFLRRKMKAEKRMRSLLGEANIQKEAFISQFLNLCSIYMESLEQFSRVASRKIKAGQVEDLYQMIKSGKMLDEQNTLFCDIFDKAFTRIYPTFVDGVNALLAPDKQIQLADGELMNTELRILAFMRLGTEDSSQIARFLQLSLNTIYTYRNKLKNKAINRNTFEQDVMRIARIE